MKIALIGYGKMGKAIEEIALNQGHSIVLKISSGNKEEMTTERIKSADVAIEFTRPESAFYNIQFCLNNDIPVVSGTTGWLRELPQIESLCKKRNGSFLYASNFSIGVNIFFALNKALADLMKSRQEYNVLIEETHHIHKKDAPSGTAITLAEGIIESGIKESYSGEGHSDGGNLTITSIRKDEIPGTHLIKYFSENDQIEIIHTAHNRKGFAAGAVAAAAYIKDKKGIFSMNDVLGLNGNI